MMNDAFILGVSQFNTRKLCDLSPPQTILSLSSDLLNKALQDASPKLSKYEIDGLFAVRPTYCIDESIRDSPPKYLYPTWLASKLDLYKPTNKPFTTKTLECGGSTVISMCITAKNLIKNNNSNCIAILLIDIPNSAQRNDYINTGLKRFQSNMDELNIKKIIDVNHNGKDIKFKTPPIASLYASYTKSFLDKYGIKYGITREHLAMIPCLMYRNGYKHPHALCYKNDKLYNFTTNDIIQSKQVTQFDCLKQYECARLCDGGICIIVVSKTFLLKHNSKYTDNRYKIDLNRCFKIKSSGEYVNNFYIKPNLDGEYINYSIFHSVQKCLNDGNIHNVSDIDWYGLYDCYPIVFLFGLISTGIVSIENVSKYLEDWYYNNKNNNVNINTHGGLLGFGAPGIVPCAFMIIEAIKQLRNEATSNRQIKLKRNKLLKALIIGNGSIFQFSSVMLIEKYDKNIGISKL